MVKTYKVTNLDCANCAQKIEDAVRKLDGVEDVSVNFLTQRLKVTAAAIPEQLLEQIQRIARKIEPGTEVVER